MLLFVSLSFNYNYCWKIFICMFSISSEEHCICFDFFFSNYYIFYHKNRYLLQYFYVFRGCIIWMYYMYLFICMYVIFFPLSRLFHELLIFLMHTLFLTRNVVNFLYEYLKSSHSASTWANNLKLSSDIRTIHLAWHPGGIIWMGTERTLHSWQIFTYTRCQIIYGRFLPRWASNLVQNVTLNLLLNNAIIHTLKISFAIFFYYFIVLNLNFKRHLYSFWLVYQ